MTMRAQTQPIPPLQDAIQELYRVFAAYPMPQNTDPCPCCHTAADVEQLKSRPLRELGATELSQYAFDGLLTWGDDKLFRHLLPRLYELMVFPEGDPLYVDPEILLSKLRHGRWQDWPETDQNAVRLFLRSLLRARLGHPNPDAYTEDIESWICAIAQAEDDLGPYLAQWEADDRLEAAEALASLLLCTSVATPFSNAGDAFWKSRDPQYQQLKRWVRSGEPAGLLIRAMASADETARAELEAALSMLSG